jgi:hypothetical protein
LLKNSMEPISSSRKLKAKSTPNYSSIFSQKCQDLFVSIYSVKRGSYWKYKLPLNSMTKTQVLSGDKLAKSYAFQTKSTMMSNWAVKEILEFRF